MNKQVENQKRQFSIKNKEAPSKLNESKSSSQLPVGKSKMSNQSQQSYKKRQTEQQRMLLRERIFREMAKEQNIIKEKKKDQKRMEKQRIERLYYKPMAQTLKQNRSKSKKIKKHYQSMTNFMRIDKINETLSTFVKSKNLSKMNTYQKVELFQKLKQNFVCHFADQSSKTKLKKIRKNFKYNKDQNYDQNYEQNYDQNYEQNQNQNQYQNLKRPYQNLKRPYQNLKRPSPSNVLRQ